MSFANSILNGFQTISNGFVNHGPAVYNVGTLLLATGTGLFVTFLGEIMADSDSSNSNLSKVAILVGSLSLGVLTSAAIMKITHPFTPVKQLFSTSIDPFIGAVAVTALAIPVIVGGIICAISYFSTNRTKPGSK